MTVIDVLYFALIRSQAHNVSMTKASGFWIKKISLQMTFLDLFNRFCLCRFLWNQFYWREFCHFDVQNVTKRRSIGSVTSSLDFYFALMFCRIDLFIVFWIDFSHIIWIVFYFLLGLFQFHRIDINNNWTRNFFFFYDFSLDFLSL